MAGDIRIGTSGFSYEHWRGPFYPEDLPRAKWLEYYCANFQTLELDNPFYRLPSKDTFDDWARRAPDDFLFSVKASRYITHVKKLADIDSPLAKMLGHYSHLGAKLGPVLFQFPPRWHKNLDRLGHLLDVLPAGLACAFEFRDPTWLTEDTLALLRAHGSALCIADSPAFPKTRDVTAPFVMIRMHGGPKLYSSEYSEEELGQWARRIRRLSRAGKDVFVYFNNDAHGFAVANARRLKSLLGQRSTGG